MKPQRRHFGTKPMTRAQGQHALRSLLLNCRDEALAGFTAENLCGYNVPLETRRAMIEAERGRRGW